MDSAVEQYMEKAKVAYERGMDLLSHISGWKKIGERHGVAGYTRSSEGSNHKTFKAEFFVEKPPKFVSRYIFDHFPELNEEFNSDDLESVRETRSEGPNMHLHEVLVKSHGPVNARELETCGVYLELGDEIYCEVGVSVDTGRPPRPNCVKAELILGVSHYEPVCNDPNRTHCELVILVDPKGSVPAMIVNGLMGSRTKFYEQIRDKINNL
jgi:hypothetical protein